MKTITVMLSTTNQWHTTQSRKAFTEIKVTCTGVYILCASSVKLALAL